MNYLKHFGLRELPFGITPDTSYFFACRAIQEAFNTLHIAVGNGEGFIKITGEVGTGKTLLCRRFLAAQGDEAVTCYLPNPLLTPATLMLALADELELKLSPQASDYELLKALNDELLALAAEDRRVIVCVDEAQALPLKSLETLRLLSNLETEKRKLLQVVLFGQPELEHKLAQPQLRQLRQRIAFRYRLGTLGRDETGRYLAHRLRVAGHPDGALFSPGAVATLQRASRGTPRVANILAHKALLAAFGEGASAVSRAHVRAAARDTPEPAGLAFAAWRWLLR
ncbi:MAG TPA: AAA family ATPase [Albitalea sp.]